MAKKLRLKPRGRQANPHTKDILLELVKPDPNRKDLLIEYLHVIQDKYGCISKDKITALADLMNLSMSEVYEVASFYHHFEIVENEEQNTLEYNFQIRVCDSLTCQMFGSKHLKIKLDQISSSKYKVHRVSCVGRCDKAPVAVVGKNTIVKATPEAIDKAVKQRNTEPARINPQLLQSYLESGGYNIYKKCLEGKLERSVIKQMLKDSNLRGLGGAGFPAGVKWEIVSRQKERPLLVVNIDEGEPGTFKDKFYLETEPHTFLEGMLIAGWVIKTTHIYIYLRDEYHACLKMLEKEIKELSGYFKDTLPKIEVRRGAGAYICGEESAMIESIEGKRGMPRQRPPYIAEKGLFSKPTLAHNMETLYWVRDIIEKGSDWFASHGRYGSKGLRSFSVSGRIKKPGVHLAPAGITVAELIEEYCGGMEDGHELYGFFPGGASGGILSAEFKNEPLDFGTLKNTGCFIGSAAVIVLSDKDKAKDYALNAMKFFVRESCGQCTPCRVGTEKATMLMKREKWDVNLLKDISNVMRDASICGLGQAASNPLDSILKYFKHEIE